MGFSPDSSRVLAYAKWRPSRFSDEKSYGLFAWSCEDMRELGMLGVGRHGTLVIQTPRGFHGRLEGDEERESVGTETGSSPAPAAAGRAHARGRRWARPEVVRAAFLGGREE